VGAVGAAIVVVAGSYLGYQQLSDSGCTGQVKLTVAAATEIVPAVEQTAQQWTTHGGNYNGTCVVVSITGVNPATMAAAVAREHRVALTGLGLAPGSVAVPDVWIPDSSMWLLRLKSEASGFVPTDGTSVAQSPVVVAMPEPIAQTIGWPNKELGWKDLLAQMQKSRTLRTGIVDPTRDAAGLSGLLALASSAGAGVQGETAKAAALRALANGSSALRDDLLQKFPQSADAAGISGGLSAAPLSEEDVVTYNAARPPVHLAALYLEPQPAGLDYPYAVMPGVDLQKSALATALRQALNAGGFKNALAAVGLRSADGTLGANFALPVGAPQATTPTSAKPDPAQGGAAATVLSASAISQAIGGWAAVTLPAQALAVFDISGSMTTKVPTAGGQTRAQVTQGAARRGLSLFDDKWSVGMWVFSTELIGKQAWKEVVPISPLSAARAELQASIAQIVPKRGGGTGLYDTALAAYKEVQGVWQDGKVNSVLLFTDGKNENKAGLTREELIAALKKANDPRRPVRMVIIGIGDEVDRKELQDIAAATSAGGVFIAEDPARINDIFLEAMATRSGANS
jgi:Ca-activated chloride channel family protein